MIEPRVVSNLLAWSVQAGIVVLAASALARIFPIRVPRAALAFWYGVLGAVLLLPWVEPWRRPVFQTTVSLGAAAGPVQILDSAPIEAPSAARYDLIVYALAAGAALRLLWLGLGSFRLRLYRRRARPLSPVPAAIEAAEGRVGVRAQYYASEEIDSPVTYGAHEPVILLPAPALAAGAPLEAMVTHELIHVRRRDWLLGIVEEIVRAALWFHPAVWWVLGRIQLAREQAVDRETVEITQARRAYVETLVAVAIGKDWPCPTFLRQRHLQQRIACLLKEASMSRARLALSLFAVVCMLIPTAVFAAIAFPLEASAVFTPVADQAPPPPPPPQADNAQVQPMRIRVGGAVQARNLEHEVTPEYPPLARQARIQGTVRFMVVVGKEGTVQNMQLVSGHPLLVAAAQDAIRQWRYRPTLLNGNPVEVTTQVDLNFLLGPNGEAWVSQSSGGPVSVRGPFPTTAEKQGIPRIRVDANAAKTKLLSSAPAAPPAKAAEAQIKGWVVFQALISAEGRISERQLISGHPLLVPAAEEALRSYIYQPTLVDGVPAEVVTQVMVPVPDGIEPGVIGGVVGGGPIGGVVGGVPGGGGRGVVGGVPGGLGAGRSTKLTIDRSLPPGVYRVGDGVTPPKPIEKHDPDYTPEAKAAKIEGTVVLSVVIGEDGVPRDIGVIRGIAGGVVEADDGDGLQLYRGLDENAVEAVSRWRFEPGKKDGRPVPVLATIEVNFRLF